MCNVINQEPVCSCFEGYEGNPSYECHPPPSGIITDDEIKDPCNPDPCGPYSQKRERSGYCSCSCLPGYLGTPPNCHPECEVDPDCRSYLACRELKCIDPCRDPDRCGHNADCLVIAHEATCECRPGFTGDANSRQGCKKIIEPVVTPSDPCEPSPCGPNAKCTRRPGPYGDVASCMCLPDFFGNPPTCRPECTTHAECPSYLACVKNKCKDPCPGSCGDNAQCYVVNHNVVCQCLPGYTGDPFANCDRIKPRDPCKPNPCGPNSEPRNNGPVCNCRCRPGFFGDAYDKRRGCRRECETHDDCDRDKACSNEYK